MQSKNVLWLGLLFVFLLTAFCISKHINQFHPNIETISTPKTEVEVTEVNKSIDNDTKLPLAQIDKISQSYNSDMEENKSSIQPSENIDEDENNDSKSDDKVENKVEIKNEVEIDEAYLQVLELIKQEEQDIEDAYNEALKEEEARNLQKKMKLKPEIEDTPKEVKEVIEEPSYQEPKKVTIERILTSHNISVFDNMSDSEKYKLRLLMLNIKHNPSYSIKIQANQNFTKLSKVVNFIRSLGISESKIHVVQTDSDLIDINQDYIELSIIKKD